MAQPSRRQKPLLRLLLFSDLMLDRPYEWAPPSIAHERRKAARETLVELLRTARTHHVDVIASAGNLFDRRTVSPASIQWLSAALRSSNTTFLIAPGNRDFVGPLGGYSHHAWPDNVTIFKADRFTPVEVAGGVTVWGAAHTEAHRSRSFFDRFAVDRNGINLALFQGAEKAGVEREPNLESSAPFEESDVTQAGFTHALVGHYQQLHFGSAHTYPGAPIAHEPGDGSTGSAVLVSVAADGTMERGQIELPSAPLHEIEVDLTGVESTRSVVKRVGDELAGRSSVVRLRLKGRVSPDIVVQREDFVGLLSSGDYTLLDWEAEVDVTVVDLAEEQTVRGQFVRDVLASRSLTSQRRNRVLLAGLRALASSKVLEPPR